MDPKINLSPETICAESVFWATFRTSDDKCIMVGKHVQVNDLIYHLDFTPFLQWMWCFDHPQSLPPDLRDKSFGVSSKRNKNHVLGAAPFKSWLQRVFSSPLKFTSFKLCGNSLVLPQKFGWWYPSVFKRRTTKLECTFQKNSNFPTYDGNMRVSSPFFTTKWPLQWPWKKSMDSSGFKGFHEFHSFINNLMRPRIDLTSFWHFVQVNLVFFPIAIKLLSASCMVSSHSDLTTSNMAKNRHLPESPSIVIEQGSLYHPNKALKFWEIPQSYRFAACFVHPKWAPFNDPTVEGVSNKAF